MNAMTKIRLNQIEEDYDFENDLGNPKVTHADYWLLRALRESFEHIERLEEQLDRLEDIVQRMQEQ